MVIISIGSMKTKEELQIKAALDATTCAKGIKITDEEMAALDIHNNDFHGEWRYRISPAKYDNFG